MPVRPPILFALLAIAIAAAAALVPLGLPSGPGAGPGDFDRRVRGYLTSHPEVIMEAVEALRRRDTALQEARQRAAIRANRAAIVDAGPLPVSGNRAGDVTVVEFFDYRCPYCRQAAGEVKALLAADRGIRFVLKEFPVLGPESVFAARAAIAASMQGRYGEFHDALMARAGDLDEAAVIDTARAVGLDIERLRRDMGASQVAALINETHALARKLFITGTPSFVIGDDLVPGFATAADLASLVARARRR
ncbi:MAG: hypothetical protein RL477_53 [Pseudomonadota bacterium]